MNYSEIPLSHIMKSEECYKCRKLTSENKAIKEEIENVCIEKTKELMKVSKLKTENRALKAGNLILVRKIDRVIESIDNALDGGYCLVNLEGKELALKIKELLNG